MQRRDFLKRAGTGAALIPLVGLTTPAKGAETSEQVYRDFYIHWTGWKGAPNTKRIVGQWLARPVELDSAPLLFSSVPGGHGIYQMGDQFNITVYAQHGQVYLEGTSPQALKDAQMQLGGALLRGLIDERAWTRDGRGNWVLAGGDW